MGYRLGVDLGTTFTAAAVGNGQPPSMLGLGHRALQVPSVVFLTEDGEFLIGDAAERRGRTDPARMVREFKRRIGDPVPLLVAGIPFSPQALTARLLAWVVTAATERMGAEPDELVLTYPANWGGYKRELLSQVIALADIGDARTCPEPQAAAVQYAARAGLRPDGRIAVYDLGGGTFDVCVLEKRTDTEFGLLGKPDGVENLGGVDFDEAVFQHVLSALGPAATGLDPRTVEATAALARLRRDCVEAKEALSADVETAIPVTLPGLTTSVRLTRAELESLIGPPLRDTIAATGRALRSAGVPPEQLTAIVLVGGSSRIPLVSHLLQGTFGVPTAVDIHPKHDVALGALHYDASATMPLPAVPPQDVLSPPEPESLAEPGQPPAAPVQVAEPPGDRPGRRRWLVAAGGASAAALVVIAGVVLALRGDDDGGPAGTPSNPGTTSSPTVVTGAGGAPYALAVSNNGNRIYATNRWRDTVSVIDTVRRGPVGTPIPVGNGPLGTAVIPGGSRVYAVNGDGNDDSITEIDTTLRTTLATIKVGRNPLAIAVLPGQNQAYVTNRSSDDVSVVDIEKAATVGRIRVGDGPLQLVLAPARHLAYVSNQHAGTISVIDFADDTIDGAPIDVPDRPQSLALSPDEARLYISHTDSRDVTVVDTDTRAQIATITLPAVPWDIAVGRGGRWLYASLNDTDQVAVVNLEDEAVSQTLAVGRQPKDLAMTTDLLRLYVANSDAGTISVINTVRDKVIDTILVSG